MFPRAGPKSSGQDTDPDKIVYPAPMGRPEDGALGCREHSAVLTARTEERLGAVRLHGIIMDSTGINIPYNKIHQISRDENLASEHPKKSKRRKWIRFERVTYSNSMRYADCKLLDDGRRLLCCEEEHRVLSQGTASLSARHCYRRRAGRA